MSYRCGLVSDLLVARPRLTAWTVADGHNQYGRFSDRRTAEWEAARRRALGASSVRLFEVWLNPRERVVVTALCERCRGRLPHFDGRVVSSTASIICGPCSEQKVGAWSKEPTVVRCCPVEHDYVDNRRPLPAMPASRPRQFGSQIQALERAQPILPMDTGQPERQAHGTLDLFASLNVATGEVIARYKQQHRAKDFLELPSRDRQAGHMATLGARSCRGREIVGADPK